MAYEAYHHGQLQDYEYPVQKVEEATLAPAATAGVTHLPKVTAFA